MNDERITPRYIQCPVIDDDDDIVGNISTMIRVDAKKRGILNWKRKYGAKFIATCIVLHDASKRNLVNGGNTIIDLTKVIALGAPIEFDDNKNKVKFASPVQVKYITVPNSLEYDWFKDNIQHILCQLPYARNEVLNVEQSEHDGMGNGDFDDDTESKPEKAMNSADLKKSDTGVTSESLNDPLKRNLDLLKMGFAVRKKRLSVDSMDDEMKDSPGYSRQYGDNAFSKSGVKCKHEGSVTGCACVDIYEHGTDLIQKATDLLVSAQAQRNYVDALCHKMMIAMENERREQKKALGKASEPESICVSNRNPVKALKASAIQEELDSLMFSTIALDESERSHLSVGRSRFYDHGKRD